MGFGGKKAVISVVGKRCAISGVPAFLDDALKPWREKLHQAARGAAPLEAAIEARALKEILALTVAGKGKTEEVRRLYPFGLSSEMLSGILVDTQLALNKTTLKTRTIIATLCVIFCAAIFYGLFIFGLEGYLTFGWNRFLELAADLAVLAGTLSASWAMLNFSARFVLKRRFPQLALALKQKIGKTGLSMLGGIVLSFIIFILLAPVKPLWLLHLVH